MTTTQEYIERLSAEAKHLYGRPSNAFLLEIAQRLRELDKPDCIYTRCADDSPTPNTLESGCGGAMWYLGDDGKGEYPKFCHHCGGSAKEAV